MNIKLKIINKFLDRIIPQIYKGIRNMIAIYLKDIKILYLRLVVKMPIDTYICEYIMKYNFIDKYIEGRFIKGYNFDIKYILDLYLEKYIIIDVYKRIKLLCIYNPDNNYELFELLLDNQQELSSNIINFIIQGNYLCYIHILKKRKLIQIDYF